MLKNSHGGGHKLPPITGEGLRKAGRQGHPLRLEVWPPEEPERGTMTGGAALWLAIGAAGLLLFIAGLIGLVAGGWGVFHALTMGGVAFRG